MARPGRAVPEAGRELRLWDGAEISDEEGEGVGERLGGWLRGWGGAPQPSPRIVVAPAGWGSGSRGRPQQSYASADGINLAPGSFH